MSSVIIRLKGLPLSAASADIRAFFGGLRIPDGAVNIVGGEDGDAFIGFVADEDARQAMRMNHGRIHNTEVRLFLSSHSEMREVIENARSAPLPPSFDLPPTVPPRFRNAQPPSFDLPPTASPRFRNTMPSPRSEKEESSRYPSREDSRFNRDAPSYRRKDEEPPRYGREGPSPMNGNGRPPFPQHGRFSPDKASFFGNEPRFDERKIERGNGRMNGTSFQAPSYGFDKNEQRKSDESEIEGHNGRWMNGDKSVMGGFEKEDRRFQKDTFVNNRQEDADNRIPNRGQSYGLFENRNDDKDQRKEESWRSDNNRSFDRHNVSNGSFVKEDDPISFFGRSAPLPINKRSLLPSPSIPPPSIPPPSFPPPIFSSLNPVVQAQKDEVFVELTRLPSDLLRPSMLEEFLSPSTPLTLSSVRVIYSPEGIHLSSIVRFTSPMDGFNSLKKDGEHGVKIRPSTKEAFELARDGPPSTQSNLPPQSFHPHSNLHSNPIPPFPTVPQMGGLAPPGGPRLNLFTMPLINPNEMMMGNERREVREEINEGRGERKRRDDSPPRGRREEKRRRSMSPRSKKGKGDRICVHVCNLPFRTKDSEIRRMLGPNLSGAVYAIKKIFNEDNAPSDEWILEFSSESEAMETIRRRMEIGGRPARMKRMDEPEADRLLKQKFKSPPRRGERRESFDEKVRMQQEAIEIEKAKMNGSNGALAGAFSTPIFTTHRGFMRGGRGGGRGMRGEFRGNSDGTRGGRGGVGMISGMGREREGRGGEYGERNCLLVSNMPPLPNPQLLLEHLGITPTQLVRVDQIAHDAAIIEVNSEMDAITVAGNANGELFPHLNGRRLIVAAMARIQIEEEFNLRREENMDRKKSSQSSRPPLDLELVRSIGEPGCVISCDGFPRDLAIDAVKSFFDGYPLIESSVRMRMEGGEGTGECMLAFSDRSTARKAAESLNGRLFRGTIVTLNLV